MGFNGVTNSIFCNWIKTIFLSTKFPHYLNGRVDGYLSIKRGMRQTYHLSHFIVWQKMSQVRGLTKMANDYA